MMISSGLNIGKKGVSPGVMIASIATMFGIAIIIVLTALINHYVTDGFKTNSPVWDSDMEHVYDTTRGVFSVFDYVVVVLFFVLNFGIIATSKKLATRRIFYVVVFILSIFYGFLGYVFSYVFQNIIENSLFVPITASFPLTILIATNLHWFALVQVAVGSVVLFSKKEKGQFTISE